MNPLVAVRDDFACRDKSKVIASLEFFDYQDSEARKKRFDWSSDFHKVSAFGRVQDERYPAFSYGELRVALSRWNIKNSCFWNIGGS